MCLGRVPRVAGTQKTGGPAKRVPVLGKAVRTIPLYLEGFSKADIQARSEYLEREPRLSAGPSCHPLSVLKALRKAQSRAGSAVSHGAFGAPTVLNGTLVQSGRFRWHLRDQKCSEFPRRTES